MSFASGGDGDGDDGGGGDGGGGAGGVTVMLVVVATAEVMHFNMWGMLRHQCCARHEICTSRPENTKSAHQNSNRAGQGLSEISVKQRTLLNHTRYDDPSIRTDTTQVNSVTTVPIT